MKSKLLLAGLLGALTLTSCVDTNESDSVAAVRNAKANLLNAQAEAAKIEANANASKASAEAALKQAEAEYQQAEAARVKAEAEYQAALTELQKIQNELAQKQGDLELQAKAKEAEARIAQAEATKAEAEAAKQKAENDMAEATIEHQKYLLVLQAQLLQAQQELENLETSLKADDIAKYKNYANLYYNAVQDVIDLEKEIANAKLVLEETKIYSTDADLYYSSTNTASVIEMYKGYIAGNDEQIEKYKAKLARYEARVEMLKNCEECTSGDTEALLTKIEAKQHEYQHSRDAWNAANGAKNDELDEAYEKATAYGTETNKALMAAVEEAQQAIEDDPYYKLIWNDVLTVDKFNFNLNSWSLAYDIDNEWVDLGNDTLAYKEYTESDIKQDICFTMRTAWNYFPANLYSGDLCYPDFSIAFAEWSSSKRDSIQIVKYQESYAQQIKNNTEVSATFKSNAKVYNQRAAQLENAMSLDYVVAGGVYCDSLEIGSTTTKLGVDSVYLYKVKKGEPCHTYTLADLKGDTSNGGEVQRYYQNAKSWEETAESVLDNNEYISAESEALALLVKMVTTDEYKDALAAKCEAYKKALYALYTPVATAYVERAYYWRYLEDTDAEYVALCDLKDEIEALEEAYYAMCNGNAAIESAESYVEDYTNQIKNLEQANASFEQKIKDAETSGKVSELDIKQGFENNVANQEAQIDLMEKQLATKQTIAAAYKAIVDSLVETAE